MNQKLLSKVLATMLVMTLTLANVILLGVNATKSYATSDNLEKQETVTNNQNVEFDAYFKDDKGNKVHSLNQNIQELNTKLYLQVKVKKGYLKDAKITAFGEEVGKPANFNMQNSNESLAYIQKVDTQKNKIELKQVNQGTEIVMEIPVLANKENSFDISNFSKENSIKLTGSYVDNEGKTITIDKTIKVRNEWNGVAKAVVSQTVQRYVPYEVNGNKGIILQTVIKSGLENNTLPIEQTNIEITVPEINGSKPNKVNVVANSMLATKGQNGVSFGQENWSYDAEKGIIYVHIDNPVQENKVAWAKNGQDEFVITYIFPEVAITDGSIHTSQAVKVAMNAYNNVETKVEENTAGAIELTEKMGEIVTQEVISMQEGLSKGYLYNKADKETEYTIKSITDIGYAALVDKITVQSGVDNFVNEKGETFVTGVSNINYAYYKKTMINKASFQKIFGEEGSFIIRDQDGATLATFNKDSQTDDNGNFVYEYQAENNKVTIETSKPVTEGRLVIGHVKSLKGKTDYSKGQVASFKNLITPVITTVFSQDMVIGMNNVLTNIPLVDPTTKMEVGLSTDSLSTVVKNENVQIRVILKTNDLTCDLYKNPTVEIVLPSYVQDITIKDINLLFDNELQIKDYTVVTNSEGNKVIKVTMQGENTKYNQDEISKGANLVMDTDITVKQLTPTKQDVMKVYVTNENATSYEMTETTKARSATTKGYAEMAVKAVAPVGIVTTNGITNYNSKNESVTSISGQEQVGKLETRTGNKTATISGSVINNYNNVVKNISILGRLPFEGNKEVVTGSDLGSNITASLAKVMQVNGATVYYSANAEASKDVNNATNGWTTAPTELSSIKSYLIVFNEYQMNTGDTITFQYNINIPGDLSYNRSMYSNYIVYFDNITADGTTSEKVVATKVGVSTGEGPELQTTISASVANGADVEEGTIITYETTVKNIGKKAVKNVVVTGNVPTGTVYTEYISGDEYSSDGYVDDYEKTSYTKTIPEMAAGESVTIKYCVKVKTLISTTEEVKIEVATKINAEGLEKEITTQSIVNKVVEGFFKTQMNTFPNMDNGVVREGQEIRYTILVENVSLKDRKNVIVKTVLPEGITYKEAYTMKEDKVTQGVTYDEKTRTVTWNLGDMPGQDKVTVEVLSSVNGLTGSNNKLEMKTKAEIRCEGTDRVFTTNEVSNHLVIPTLEVTHKSNRPDGVMTDEDTIEYYINIKNIGKAIAKDIVVKDFIPAGLTYEGTKYTIEGKTTEIKNGTDVATLSVDINPGQEAQITIMARANKVENAEYIEIENIVTVDCKEADDVTVNSLKHRIQATSENVDGPGGDITDKTYKISGTAWLDSNKDGKRDESEPTLGGIDMMLINAENGSVVKDKDGNSRVIATDDNGKYTFEGLKQGKYIVVFLYDAGQYDVTVYRAKGVNESENSDAITMKINLNGTIRNGAVSDNLTLNSNIYNIDIGLIVNPKFDLKLDKVISKITVSDVKGSKVHEYKDSKLAKLDIDPKLVNGTTIAIEYKIRVTNEGGIAGYAKKIVDYLPDSMKFNSELNTDWYTSEQGNIYNTSLANILLQPGETKELTLILTKKMTESNTGIINNTAEIFEAYNDLGKADIDSTPANKVQGEDDMSSADATIGIKTGEVYIYLTVTLISIGLLGVGIYFINKKVLRKI